MCLLWSGYARAAGGGIAVWGGCDCAASCGDMRGVVSPLSLTTGICGVQKGNQCRSLSFTGRSYLVAGLRGGDASGIASAILIVKPSGNRRLSG